MPFNYIHALSNGVLICIENYFTIQCKSVFIYHKIKCILIVNCLQLQLHLIVYKYNNAYAFNNYM